MTCDGFLAKWDNSGGRHATMDLIPIEAYEMLQNKKQKNTVSQRSGQLTAPPVGVKRSEYSRLEDHKQYCHLYFIA